MARPKKVIPQAEIEAAQATHEQYKKFDVFHARIQKEQVTNPYTTQPTTIIRRWQLYEKAQELPSFVEEDLVNAQGTGFNWFATNDAPVHKLYLPQGKYNVGDFFNYEDFADMLGLDKKKDINILLAN